jgi:NADH dehydrogenase FAD-containing subunit
LTEPDAEARQRLLTVVVIGGGFSGVEIAGHIADLMRAIRRFYPELKHETPHIVLLHKGKHLLPELHHESLSKFTLQKLRQNGIKVRLETSAKKVDSVAVQQARQLAENLQRVSQGATTKLFDFRPRGMLASIGPWRSSACRF